MTSERSRAVEIRLPQFGMGMQEGTVIEWFKREGDPVAPGEVVAEIEAAKATEELVAQSHGIMLRILVAEGETVEVNAVLAFTGPEGAQIPDQAVGQRQPSANVAAATQPPPVAPVSAESGPRRQMTPRARRLALELGVDIEAVVGSGPDGRVTEDDVAASAQTGLPS
jgi:pyruvate dehydrogenase E2 component (dihydrolipoamide acetyltransferase)